jgi:predicted Zn-dependent protease with MMP-like domain
MESFVALVAKALSELPAEFQDRLENIDIVVQDYPTPHQLAKVGLRHWGALLGLYEGVPRTRRTAHYGMVLPDKISIFQKPIEAKCRSEEQVAAEIQRVVLHEIAHHFGISDERLRQIETERLKG